jgi:leader peptidase (prepilin peptidase)/N-methyltransferase
MTEPLRVLLASPVAFTAAVTVAGLMVGSFANVVIHRLPARQSVVWPASRCPACGAGIAAYDNIPVVSYLLLRGRCRACGAPISARYPLVESLNGLAWAGAAWRFGPTVETLVMLGFVTALLILCFIDLEHYLLPDAITLPGVAAGVLASLLPGPPSLLESALSAAAGYVVFWLIARTYRLARGVEGLGQGDWKMAAMLGAFLGGKKLLIALFVAALGGSVVGLALMALGGARATHKLPFGTFIGFAGIATVLAGDALWGWYAGLSGL